MWEKLTYAVRLVNERIGGAYGQGRLSGSGR